MSNFLYILHLLGMTMGVGTGFVMIGLQIGTKDMEPQERGRFMMRAMVAGKVSAIGLAILIVTGVIMVVPLWSDHASSPFFMVKLTLVAVLVVLYVFQQGQMARLKRDDGGPALAVIPKLARAMHATGILIVIAAVLVFH